MENVGRMIEGNTSIIIPTTVPLSSPIKLCDFFDFNNCLHPAVYKDKSKIPTKTGDGGILCPLGAGVIPRWCPLKKGIMPKKDRKKGKEEKHSETMVSRRYPLNPEDTIFWISILVLIIVFCCALLGLVMGGIL